MVIKIRYIRPIQWQSKIDKVIDDKTAWSTILRYTGALSLNLWVRRFNTEYHIQMARKKVEFIMWDDEKVFPVMTAGIPELLWHERGNENENI